ncbi:MAG: hypothetical protein U7123_07295 [Potamolinea sp.]
MSELIYPWHPEFHQSLAVIPPDFYQARHQHSGDVALICQAGSDLMLPLGGKDLEEYIQGGEWDERTKQLQFLEQLENAAWNNIEEWDEE